MPSSDAFADLAKLPAVPAARILAQANAVLQTPLALPVSAPVTEVLAALDEHSALVDMLMVLAHALPAREATWLACLAARDMVPEGQALPPALKAAERWVYQPGEETRAGARAALDAVSNEDETELCAMAAAFSNGTLGPGELEDFEAPPGAVGTAVFGMLLKSLFHDDDKADRQGQVLLARALDIARGGNGNVPPSPVKTGIKANEEGLQ
ncbi:hypothetical protein [Roseibium sp. RKSG952]|uniref:DUF6931 family protein n=1 Tax=Roseibium sp. RKSG952 TaxID=2529384 RepID=UPI0012BB948F|nr:hypothetical protein [Roseibium sp. RKSG952]MTH98016.1 hypothetical protein [Roseibium sp. RKSG952]